MNFSMLLEEALEERGNAVLVIARPVEAEQAVIQNSNRLFARMVGQPAHALIGRTVGSLRNVAADSESWGGFMAALRGRAPAQLDMRLQLGGRDLWLGFGLTFKTDPQEGGSYGILIGRDITQARRNAAKETESQRLLAAMFLRTSAALLVVRPDGGVVMANPAFQRLLGYTAEEIPTLNAQNLTAGEFTAMAQVARAKQLRDGATFEIRIETVGKNGVGVPVRLTSVLVKDSGNGSLRVVTLIPDFAAPAPALASAPPRPAAASRVPSRSIGQLQAISLAAFKTAFADAWPRVAPRAMLMAEQIIRRRLGAADVLNRSDDHGFVIWFDHADEEANAAVLARAAREIKLKFLSEFGEEVAACVTAVVVGNAWDPPPGALPPQALLDRLHQKRQEAAVAAKRLIAQLAEPGSAIVQPITDREGRLKPFVLADFNAELRRQAAAMMAAVAGAEATEIDLLRLDFAARELGSRRGGVLVPISWPTLIEPAARRLFDEHAARIGTAHRANLQLALSDVPPFPNADSWTEIVGPLRRSFGEIGLMVTLAEDDARAMQEAVAAEWPLSLLVVDATATASMAPDGYFGVMAAARSRDIAVLARVADADDRRDWHELGATMFAG